MIHPEMDAAGILSDLSGHGSNRTGVSVSSFIPYFSSESALLHGKNPLCDLHSGFAAIINQPPDVFINEGGRHF
jgi:hypothetical protein